MLAPSMYNSETTDKCVPTINDCHFLITGYVMRTQTFQLFFTQSYWLAPSKKRHDQKETSLHTFWS